MSPVAAIGVDAGSTTCKVVAVNSSGEILAHRLELARPLIDKQCTALIAELLEQLGGDEKTPVVATGYGRRQVSRAQRAVTEITCHARGVFAQLGRAGTLVDIGGQDSKVILIGPDGRPLDFAMNDKCAAGTGRFLEHTAARLDVALDDLGPRALAAKEEATISSTCTVFAESEIISLIAHGQDLDAILRGLHRSLCSRVAAMVHSVGLRPPLMLSGGVARNVALRQILGETLGETVILPQHPQLMGALGAALLALG